MRYYIEVRDKEGRWVKFSRTALDTEQKAAAHLAKVRDEATAHGRMASDIRLRDLSGEDEEKRHFVVHNREAFKRYFDEHVVNLSMERLEWISYVYADASGKESEG